MDKVERYIDKDSNFLKTISYGDGSVTLLVRDNNGELAAKHFDRDSVIQLIANLTAGLQKDEGE